MPKAKVRARGGSIRTRTKVLKRGPGGRTKKYAHIEIVRKKGPRGGRTVMGPVRTVKRRARKKRAR